MKWSRDLLRPSPLSLIALTLGALLGFAFPQPGMGSLAWIIPGGLVLFLFKGTTFFEKAASISPLQFGWMAGFAFWLLTLRWLLSIPFPSGAIMGWLSLSAYLACYFALWTWSVHKIGAGLNLFRCSLFAAATWVVLEWVRGWLFSGFAWNMLGASQSPISPLIQMVSTTGIYGLSFLMVAFSVSWVMGAYELIQSLRKRRALDEQGQQRLLGFFPVSAFKEGLFWLLVVALCTGWGFMKLSQGKALSPSQESHASAAFTIAQIQPSVPQTLLWDADENKKRFSELLTLTKQVVGTNKVDLLLWPEAAVPGYIRYDRETSNQVSQLAQKLRTPILFCTDDAEPHPENPEETLYFNCAFMMDEHGELLARSIKRHLVIFGEYVPLSRWFPFLKLLTPISGNYTPGQEVGFFPWPNETNGIAPLICFEDVFPEEVRKHASESVSAFVYLVNAGWFNESCAHWQHLANAQFRSVENNRAAIRCTQNGITCWIDRRGRVHDIFYDSTSNPYGRGGQIIQVPAEELQPPSSPTFYQRGGPIVIWCSLLWILREVMSFYLKRRKQKLYLK